MMDVLYKRRTVVVKIDFGLRKKSGKFGLYYDSYLAPYRANEPLLRSQLALMDQICLYNC